MKKALLTLILAANALCLSAAELQFVESVPEECNVWASSPKYEHEIISFADKPFFGVQFNPEKGGDGRMILANFERFVGVWEKYHK